MSECASDSPHSPWECPRCWAFNAPWVDKCACQDDPRLIALQAKYDHIFALLHDVYFATLPSPDAKSLQSRPFPAINLRRWDAQAGAALHPNAATPGQRPCCRSCTPEHLLAAYGSFPASPVETPSLETAPV